MSRIAWMMIVLCLWSGPAYAALAVDSEESAGAGHQTNNSTTLTYSFTNTAGTLLLVWAVYTSSGTVGTVSGVTYNSIGLTEITGSKAHWDTSASSKSYASWWYLVTPATGANNIVVTIDQAPSTTINILAGAISFTGQGASPIAQSTSNISDSATTTSPAVSLNNVLATSIVLTGYSHGGAISGGTGYSAGQTQSFLKNVNTNTAGNNIAGTRMTGSGTLSPTVNVTASDLWGVGMVEIAAPSVAKPRRAPVVFQ